MNDRILIPHRALQPYIQHYVYCEMGIPGKWTSSDMTPPGCTLLSIISEKENILISENDDLACKYESATLVGQTTRFKKLRLYDQIKSFFVIFRPCGAYQLLGISQYECRDLCINFTDLIGREAQFFEEELAEQSSAEGIQSVVEKFFLKRIPNQRKRMESARLAEVIKRIRLHSFNSSLIYTLCRQEGYSISSLERHMKKIVGVGPKQYQRIMRFNSVLQFIDAKQTTFNWSRIANHFGYYDQTHFINEFKLFYGKTPAGYLNKDNFLNNAVYQK